MKHYTRIVFALALCCASVYGQTVAASLTGSVVDPADAVVASVPVTLTNTGTGATRSATTDDLGTFRFQNIEPGTYNVLVKATGFKAQTQTGIVVNSGETHNAGKMVLQLGSVTDSVSVTAEAAQVQLASSDKSQTVGAAELEGLTLKGRDLFGYLRLVPGVIDTTASRDVTSPNNIGGITINGNTSAKNFTVDGITDMDTGSNGSVHYEPNLDSIQELKVLASNYQAEFGRNSGGTITVVTKNGTQMFHGTAAWNHRHEQFNANSWANNHTLKNGAATPRIPYRFNVETYSLGGPLYIPGHLNRDKKRLFFFWSQEYTGQFVSGGSQTQYTPTAIERNGDFSQTFTNSNGNAVITKLLDPSNANAQFPGNVIPTSRINPVGQQLLNFFPLPNFTPTQSTQLFVNNYFEQASATHPRRNDVARIDAYITSKISAYARWIHDADDMTAVYQGVQFTKDVGGLLGEKGISPIDHPNPGHSYAGTLTYTITPTLINEVTVAESWNTWSWYSLDNYASESRSLIPGLPVLFPPPTAAQNGNASVTNGYMNLLPTFSFGGSGLPASMSYSRNSTSAGAYENFNPIYTYQDNVSKVIGHHAFKGGIYFEKNNKIQPAGRNYMGSFSFAASTSNPFVNTNDGYANALLGNVASYTQSSGTLTFNTLYYNAEFYLQDNWKVNRRLTLDLGVRLYHQTPQVDLNNTFVNFVAANYNKAAVSRLYQPYCSNGAATCSSVANGLAARDSVTGAIVSSAYVGSLVPGSGNPTTGMVPLGVNGVSANPYTQAPIAVGPRIGFAYDLFGDGKTALRGGWGLFYNRLDGNQVYGMSAQAPLVYSQSVSSVTLGQIAALNTGATPSISSVPIAPVSPNAWPFKGNVPFDAVGNASLDIQRNIGNSMVIDVGYTLNYSYNQKLTYNINWVPIGTGWPFTQSNLSPVTAGSSSNDIGVNYERKLYPGYGSINAADFKGTNNYNAFTLNLTKRSSHGLAWGMVYTFSKGMGVTGFNPAVPDNHAYNYGRLGSDRTHNLQVNYNYDIPGLGKRFGLRALGILTDNWVFSGIASTQSGAPYNPGCSLTSGSASVTGGYTGSPDVGVRCNIVGDPQKGMGTNGNGQVFFNANAYAMASINTTGPNNSLVGPPVLGNQGGGSGNLSLPAKTNFDVTLTRNIALGSEKRVLKLQAQAYNVFNHTEISGINTGIQFNPTTNVVSNPTGLGYLNATLPSRVVAFSARFQF